MTVQYVMLGIDLDYPDELHGLLDDYPLTSKKNHQRNVSQYQLGIMNEHNFCLNEIKNIVINQRDKEFYHSSNQNN